MEKTNRELFAQAICEALAGKYDEELADCTEKAECSLEHYKKMSEILGFDVVPKRRKPAIGKRIAIVILAAALLLVGCTAIIFRHEIKQLIEEVFDTFTVATYDEDRDSIGSGITDYYAPTYIPDGYIKVNEIKNSAHVLYEFENEEGDVLRFQQYLLNGTAHRFDYEELSLKEIRINNAAISCRFYNEAHNYIWNDGFYGYVIVAKHELSFEELSKIINGLILQE